MKRGGFRIIITESHWETDAHRYCASLLSNFVVIQKHIKLLNYSTEWHDPSLRWSKQVCVIPYIASKKKEKTRAWSSVSTMTLSWYKKANVSESANIFIVMKIWATANGGSWLWILTTLAVWMAGWLAAFVLPGITQQLYLEIFTLRSPAKKSDSGNHLIIHLPI